MSVELQITILMGTMFGLIVAMILWVLIGCCMLERLKHQVDDLLSRHSGTAAIDGVLNFAYNHADIQAGEELSRRGYSMHGETVVAPRLPR